MRTALFIYGFTQNPGLEMLIAEALREPFTEGCDTLNMRKRGLPVTSRIWIAGATYRVQ